MPFRPSIASTVALLLLVSVSISLGRWQLARAAEKEQRIELFSSATELVGLPEPATATEFTRVVVRGEFELEKHVLADNQVLSGQAGVHVYTPFHSSGGQHILVNRGWLPLAADRRQLPAIVTPVETVEISGRIGPVPRAGRQLGSSGDISPDQWPQLITYPEIEAISAALNRELYPLVLFLDEGSPAGFAGRNWRPVYMTPAKHKGYAFQWFSLGLAAVIGWFVLAFQRGKKA